MSIKYESIIVKFIAEKKGRSEQMVRAPALRDGVCKSNSARRGRSKVRRAAGWPSLHEIAGLPIDFRSEVLPGDNVTVELSPYDLSKGRITYRHRG